MQITPIYETKERERQKTIPFFKRVGIFISPFFIFGVLIPLLIYTIMMGQLGWPSPLVGLRGVITYFTPTSSRVIMYVSPTTRAYFAKIGGNYDTLLIPWRGYFLERKQNVTEIDALSKLENYGSGVLILPSTLVLSDVEKSEIALFRKRGGSVLTTWATGTRNSNGDWTGWQFLETLGVKVVGEIPADSEARQLILNGESPLSHTHPAGQRIWMSKTSESLLRLKGEQVAGRFMNWARVTDEAYKNEGAIVYAETVATSTASSRTASFAFSESTWESHPLLMYGVIDNTLSWLLREPTILKSAWPNGKKFAQVIEMDTEEGFANSLSFAEIVKSVLNYKATFYILTSVGKEFPEILNKLAKEFEIAYHGDIHVSFKDELAPLQEQRIINMQQQMKSVVTDTKNINGFRAPTEGYSEITERLIQKYGIRHHAVDPQRTEGRIPQLLKQEDVDNNDSLILLPRTQRDDLNLANQNLNVEQTTQALIDDFELTKETAALGWLSVHSQNFKQDAVLTRAMPEYLEYVKKNKDAMWLATANEVANWWRERERVKISSKNQGQRLEFYLTVTGDKPVNGAGLILMLPQKGIYPGIRSLKIGVKDPNIYKIDEYRAAIVFDTIEPGNYGYQVTFSLLK